MPEKLKLTSFCVALLSCLLSLVLSEERSVLADGCEMSAFQNFTQYTMADNAICDGGFKSKVMKNGLAFNGAYDKEVVLKLKEPNKIVSAFVCNNAQNAGTQNRIGSSAIYILKGDSNLSSNVTKCSDDFFDSGFYDLGADCEGQRVAIRRVGASGTNNMYDLHELRLYQTPNLLKARLDVVTISGPTPTDAKWAATNLIKNFKNRSSGNSLPARVSATGERASYESCFKTGRAQLSSDGHLLVLTVNLQDVYFQHSILVVQDMFGGIFENDMKDPQQYFQNFEIHVGNDPDYTKNPKCSGGPFMVKGSSKSVIPVKWTSDGGSAGDMWKFGDEIWCNMEGQFMTIVADLRGIASKDYEMSVCSLAVFGTRYVRAKPVPTEIQVPIDSSVFLDVEKITADASLSIGNTLKIRLRQREGASLAWVTLTEESLVTKVKLAPGSSVKEGNYTLVLESYDSAGGVYSSLKTDTITVKVLPTDCYQALSHTFAIQETINIIKEYEPTIYFPQILFSGPHSDLSKSCGGEYSQTIQIDVLAAGVTLIDQPTDFQDLRPSLAISNNAATDSTFTLTFTGNYSYAPTALKIKASFSQTYRVKTVFSTEYLSQPTITHSLTAANLTFSIPPAAAGAPPPTQSLATSAFAVAYPFKTGAGMTDALGNSPPAITPVPYSKFTADDFDQGLDSLGTTSLSSPQGVLKIQGVGSSGNLAAGTLSFVCSAWNFSKQASVVTKTLNFANSVTSMFEASFNVTCSYQPYVAPSLAKVLTSAVLTSGITSSWTLPSIVLGSFPFASTTFTAAEDVASFLSFDQKTFTVSFNGAKYSDSLRSSSVSFVLNDSEGGSSAPLPQTLELQPVDCAQALASISNTKVTTVLLQEYQPIVFFPEVLFTGPHTFSGYSCHGTYSQTVSIDEEVEGVMVVNPSAADSDQRPRVQVGATAQADAVFTLTVRARFTFGSAISLRGFSQQTFQLRTVFSPDYLQQPTVTHSLTPKQLTFSITAPEAGSQKPQQTITASFQVAYYFKNLTDSIGNKPPAILPDPYPGLNANDLKLTQQLGLTSLRSPPGLLQGLDFQGDLTTNSTLVFECPDWSQEVAGTAVIKTLNFANSVNSKLTATLNVTCAFIDSVGEATQLFDKTVLQVKATLGTKITVNSLSAETLVKLASAVASFGQSPYTSYAITVDSTTPTNLEEMVKLNLSNKTMTVRPLLSLSNTQPASITLRLSDGQGHSTSLKVDLLLPSAKGDPEAGPLPRPGALNDQLNPGGGGGGGGAGKKPAENLEFLKGDRDQFGTKQVVDLAPSGKTVTAAEIANTDPLDLLNSVAELKDVKITAEELIEGTEAIGALFASLLKDLADDKKQAALNGLMKARFASMHQESTKSPANQKQAPPPQPEITFTPIQPTAQLTMVFSQNLAGLKILKQIGNIEVKSIGHVADSFAGDIVKQTTTKKAKPQRKLNQQSGFDLGQYIDFQLLRGGEDSSPASDLGFDVVLEGLQGDDLSLRLKFENPTMVSAGSNPDMIVATVVDESFFAAETWPTVLPKGTQIFTALPRLLPSLSVEEVLAATEKVTESAASSFLTTQLIVTLVLSVSLKQMWNLFCVMQILAYSQNFIVWPAVAQMLISQIIDAIYLKKVNDMIMELGMSKYEVAKSATKNEFLREQGIQDDSLAKALGVFLIAIIVILLTVGVFFCLRACSGSGKCGQLGASIRTSLRKKIFFSGPIRYVIVGYIRLFNQFLTSGALLLAAGDPVGAAHLLPIVVLIVFPVWVLWQMLTNVQKLNDVGFKEKFGSLYAGIKSNSFSALCYHAVFCARRIDIVLMNVYFTQGSPLSGLDRSMYLQKILCFLLIQIGYLAFIHTVRPHDESIFNKLEFINEFSMMGIAYCMLNFSNVVAIQDPVTREVIPPDASLNSAVEFTAIGLISVTVLCNFGAMVYLSAKKINLACKKRSALKRHKLLVAERERRKAEAAMRKQAKPRLLTIQEARQEAEEEDLAALVQAAQSLRRGIAQNILLRTRQDNTRYRDQTHAPQDIELATREFKNFDLTVAQVATKVLLSAQSSDEGVSHNHSPSDTPHQGQEEKDRSTVPSLL